MQIRYSIVFVIDMAKSIAFYRDTVGIPLKFETPGWTEFATEGATLALHATGEPPVPSNGGDEPAGQVRLGFNVPNLNAFHERMVAHGVPCVQEPQSQFGARLAQYRGPDDLVFTVGESA